MREMMRPMLKEWLDENLPSLVERVVEKEIARISRGRQISRWPPRPVDLSPARLL